MRVAFNSQECIISPSAPENHNSSGLEKQYLKHTEHSDYSYPYSCSYSNRWRVMEEPWRCHGSGMEVPWLWHDSGISVPWRCHGRIVRVPMLWRYCGGGHVVEVW